mmetsp:Transcript_15804/g.24287  ORF Transcript_15804/g.24287 Transcript_15804/m.24287 type:complete len:214 (+) Transcript_15804:316-957(+)
MLRHDIIWMICANLKLGKAQMCLMSSSHILLILLILDLFLALLISAYLRNEMRSLLRIDFQLLDHIQACRRVHALNVRVQDSRRQTQHRCQYIHQPPLRQSHTNQRHIINILIAETEREWQCRVHHQPQIPQHNREYKRDHAPTCPCLRLEHHFPGRHQHNRGEHGSARRPKTHHTPSVTDTRRIHKHDRGPKYNNRVQHAFRAPQSKYLQIE